VQPILLKVFIGGLCSDSKSEYIYAQARSLSGQTLRNVLSLILSSSLSSEASKTSRNKTKNFQRSRFKTKNPCLVLRCSRFDGSRVDTQNYRPRVTQSLRTSWYLKTALNKSTAHAYHITA